MGVASGSCPAGGTLRRDAGLCASAFGSGRFCRSRPVYIRRLPDCLRATFPVVCRARPVSPECGRKLRNLLLVPDNYVGSSTSPVDGPTTHHRTNLLTKLDVDVLGCRASRSVDVQGSRDGDLGRTRTLRGGTHMAELQLVQQPVAVSGIDLLREVVDLLADRLPRIMASDRDRETLQDLHDLLEARLASPVRRHGA